LIIGINTSLFSKLYNDYSKNQLFVEDILLIDNLFSFESTENSDMNLRSEKEKESDVETS
jgi:hypothetical protein